MEKGAKITIGVTACILVFCATIILVGACREQGGSGNPKPSVGIRTTETQSFVDCSIKDDFDFSSSARYSITPTDLDWTMLKKKGYDGVKITVSYRVRYKKDWGLGFGYAGSPKYEISIMDDHYSGWEDRDLHTETIERYETFTVNAKIVDIENERLFLRFSTNNIQNIIYFTNIKVSYSCY